jgi:KDO2-lipid IV(A) lauroyltransferase
MTRFFTGDYLLYYLAKALSFFFRVMPINLALFIARRLGVFFSIVSRKRYRVAYANLKSALGKDYKPKELKRILRKTYANIGQGIVDLFLLPKIDKRYIERYIRFENFDIAKEVLKKEKGLIFLTAHFGTWEISHVAMPYKGLAYKGIAREQKPYRLNELLNHYRQLHGCKIIMKGPAVKEALRTLRSNGIVGMLVDQDAGKRGIFTHLFSRPASWNRGVMEMALKTGATIVPGFAIREKGPFIRFKMFDPIKLREDIDKEEAVIDGFRQYASILEDMIREHPEQWLWQHRRWKSTPVRDVVILNDKRTGHLRQSEAVLRSIRDIRERSGFKGEDIRVKIIDVEFKSILSKQFLSICGNLSNARCQGCMQCLRINLESSSYKTLMESYADIVISCGSSIAAVNLFLSKENNAKSIVIMKPSFIALERFDLAIIPKHDKPKITENVVISDGALNLIDKNRLKLYADKLKHKIGPLKERRIGLLLGGDTKDFKMDHRAIEALTEESVKAANECDAEILVTTSRRTPGHIDELLRKKFSGEKRCRLLNIVNDKNSKGIIEAILGLSDVVLVSEESISMISEAASSKSRTIVFTQGGYNDKRHISFLKNLRDKGFIEIKENQDIHTAILKAFKTRAKEPVLNDSLKVEEALAKML